MEEKIKKALDNIRPYLQNDGGDVEFIKYEDNILYIKLVGACGHCPMASQTLNNGIEKYIKEEIPEVKKVINEA